MQRETLQAMLAAHLPGASGQIAVHDGAEAVPHAALDARIARTTAWLAGQGIGPGDCVGVWLVNRVEWLVLLFALARLGATLVSINTRYRAAEAGYLLGKSRARMLIMQASFRNVDFAEALSGIPPESLPALECIVYPQDASEAPRTLLGRPVLRLDRESVRQPTTGGDTTCVPVAGPDSVAILFTTSGTTRQPKLVMHSQHTLASHAANVARANGLDAPGAKLLAGLPLCGTFGLTGVLAALRAGAPVVLMDAFDGDTAARIIREQSITHLYGSDEMFRRLLQAAPDARPFPSARVFGFAAFQPGAEEFARAARARGVPMVGLYGSSEVQALFAVQRANAADGEAVEGGGVPAAPDAEVRVRDLAGGELAAAGVAGEIEIRAPGNFTGYLDDPRATTDAVGPDGFFRTGDIGVMRPDGSFRYLTRRGDAIRLGGFLVNPAEIEDELGGLPGVAGAAVIGMTMEGAPRCVAFVVPAPEAALDEAGLLAQARLRMAAFKVPTRLWIVEALPVTQSANGTKVQRARLRDMAAERLAAPSASARQ